MSEPTGGAVRAWTRRDEGLRTRRPHGPFRFFYVSHIYRGVQAQIGQPREFLQIGAELIGAGGARGGHLEHGRNLG
ncbi:MAG: ATP phosphoribosyltransferase regulatory subunit [Actinomycetota bacterium]|nr:ATP phosphoribosyltransferase regulatory subunit [Actinomycetota bacterium]